MSRSAFQAIQKDVPVYDANTSDEDDEQDSGSFLPTPDPISLAQTPVPSSESRYFSSNFTPNEDNTILEDDYIVFGLKLNQTLIIKGQFKLELQKGSMLINNVVYHSSPEEFLFMNPISTSIPLIQGAQVSDRNKVHDKKTNENEHLFESEYKAVIKVTNLRTGLENIGNISPIYKNLFWNYKNISDYDLSKIDNDFERLFLPYSFYPIISPTNSITLLKAKQWSNVIEKLTNQIQSKALRILIIGGTNSGKTTLLKLLLQSFFNSIPKDEYISPINVIDIDPGQSEFSNPDCISLSKLSANQFGNHLSLTTSPNSINHFIGFSSPKDQPKRYELLVNDLIQKYTIDGLLQNESLLINTPGWIRGYGLNLTKDLISKINPTHLIYLDTPTSSNNQNPQHVLFEQALQDIQLDPSIEFIPLSAHHYASQAPSQSSSTNITISPRFSSAQLRLLKIQSYFHKIENFKFDFEEPLLFKAPLQVSYDHSGIKAVSFLNVSGLELTDISDLLTGTIVSLNSIDRAILDTVNSRSNSVGIPLIDSLEFNKLEPKSLKFKALALIHSINEAEKYINLYIPPFENLSKLDNEDYILIRGETETPISELASRQITTDLGYDLPFVSFDKSSDFDKVLRIRKSILKR